MTLALPSRIAATLCLLSIIAGCGKKNEFAPPPPMPVGVQKPVVRDQETFFEFPGHLEARQTVKIRTRVKGILQFIGPEFQPGHFIKKGATLFKIDDVQYKAAAKAAEANLEKTKSDLQLAEITLQRRLTAEQAISKIQIDIAKANVQIAKSLVQSAEAQLIEANDILSWCTIQAPISGRISELLIDQYNYIGSEGATELCTIVNDQTLRVYFDINERAAITHLKSKQSEISKDHPTQVTLTLANGSVYPEKATIDYADVQLNKETGTVRIRAIVPNPNGKLVAGLFVKVKIPNPDPGKNSILIPSIAIQRDLGGYYVLTTTKENTVRRNNITLGARVNHQRIILSGLTADDQIIIQGFQRVREGMKVTPQLIPLENDTPPQMPTADPKKHATPPRKTS